MKQATTVFNVRLQLNQKGLAVAIFRSSFLLQNFKLPSIQERADDVNINRPCKAEICWYGAMDGRLVDVCPTVELWGHDSEVKYWRELRNMEVNNNCSDTEVLEIVLAEDCPSKLQITHV